MSSLLNRRYCDTIWSKNTLILSLESMMQQNPDLRPANASDTQLAQRNR
jgi:hypothetical protein